MTATESLNSHQFPYSHRRARRADHRAAVQHAQASNPEKYWTVSEPATGSRSYQVQDHAGQTVGYYSLTKHEDHTELGGLVNTTGAKGVGSSVLNHLQNRPVKLDAFDAPLEGYYQKHGFQTDEKLDFDPQYAPSHWREEYGRPGVAFMSRPAQRRR